MNKTKTILMAAIIAGTLDAIAAILLYAKPPNLHNISRIFRYIASGLVGKQAYLTGPFYPIAGLILHYLIALVWSAVYVYVLFRVYKPGSVLVKMILFACLIWVIMNGFILPLSGLVSRYDGWAVMRSFTVLLLCVSLPVSLLVEKRFGKMHI